MQSFKEFNSQTIHPKLSKYGKVVIENPHKDSPLEHWKDSNKHATITPESKLNITFHSTDEDYDEIDEPPINKNISATGTIIEESDGRIWIIHPTNEFSDVKATFPKGQIEKSLTLQENAIKEAFEETGLKVKLTKFACDILRYNGKINRFYYAKRIGGHPKDMGWESQAVSLVPKNKLKEVLHKSNDLEIVDIILKGK